MVKVTNELDLRKACAAGGLIELGEGTITVTTNIPILKPCTIQGVPGNKSIITIPNDCLIAANTPLFSATNVNDIKISGVVYDGNAANQKGVSNSKGYFNFAEIRNCTGLEITGIYFHHSKSNGFVLRSCKNVKYYNNKVEDMGQDAIYMLSNCTNLDIHDNDIKTHSNSAFRLSSGATDVKIYKNTIHSLHPL